MKNIVPISLFTLFAIVLTPLWAPATGLAQQGPPPGADAIIKVQEDGKCKIDVPRIQCNGARCKRGAPVTWKVVNEYAQKVTVVLLNFRIEVKGTDWYLDPIRQIGQGANRAEHYVDVAAAGNEDLKTLVRVIEHDFFKGTYNYDIAIRFNGTGDFALCPDPMIDIDG
ncbi:MAG: hypothetical protein BMS9Abin37_2202 [Acidobacteriota bacterium]|nr:MAG: hypothetical protein BMS9Abin37_2202 [Acidobacteriota bacterium]